MIVKKSALSGIAVRENGFGEWYVDQGDKTFGPYLTQQDARQVVELAPLFKDLKIKVIPYTAEPRL